MLFLSRRVVRSKIDVARFGQNILTYSTTRVKNCCTWSSISLEYTVNMMYLVMFYGIIRDVPRAAHGIVSVG